jgi:hypothetical protein
VKKRELSGEEDVRLGEAYTLWVVFRKEKE